MTDRIMECITNPVKCKLLLEIYSQGQATARHLADAFGDIPQATLYRNLKKMLNDGILKVVEETPDTRHGGKDLWAGFSSHGRIYPALGSARLSFYMAAVYPANIPKVLWS